MGRLEKYGVCALLFVIVTVLAVSIWGPRPRKGSATSGPSTAWPSAAAEGKSPPAGPAVSPPVASGGARPLGESASPAAPADAGASSTSLPPSAVTPPSPFDGPGIPLPGTPASTAGGSSGRALRYVVKKGETLDVIAKRELGSAARWDEILKWNEGLDPRRLRAGQEILLPPGRASLASAAPAKPQAPSGPAAGPAPLSTEAASATPAGAAKSERKHRVAKGDTLYAISKRYYGRGGRFGDILAANRTVLANERDLRVGMTLVIP